MRPLLSNDAIRAMEVTSRYQKTHGSPVHIGNPELIGIHNIQKPDYGDAVTVYEKEVPVFWACGVTIQAAILQAKPELAITYAPGYMFISDIKDVNI